MSAEETRSCQVKVSTIFVFSTPDVQKAANNVYEYKRAYDATGKTYQFKSDYERMQYLIGRLGRSCNPPTVGS
jgi:hypothetical protein